jgi:hypothetical protein
LRTEDYGIDPRVLRRQVGEELVASDGSEIESSLPGRGYVTRRDTCTIRDGSHLPVRGFRRELGVADNPLGQMGRDRPYARAHVKIFATAGLTAAISAKLLGLPCPG